ncbi:hypothetical protein [Desulfovibrio sp. TomC]|uniref:hypothetical protein n=1 Tax=Desulfovibrio sp. TomC TaxID=1562888 RepID=UPI0005746CD9|nr:hypothetical protein [Desulfovibrio sp. TomC]KHK03176.1 hypothetical protein NY78_1240 [Desulfovibrio sp. TomC]
METQQTRVRFTGGALASFGYSFLFLFLFFLILPGAWGAVPFAVWWTAHLAFDDGARAEFTGRAGQVWVLMAGLAFLAYLPSLATAGLPKSGRTGFIQLALSLVLFPLDAALKLPIYRWFIENIRLTPGGRPRFTATYAGYVGWLSLLLLSLVTVVGWAWAAVAMQRWFCRHIESEAYVVSFTGTGWGLLWRSLFWLVGMVLLLPLPWVFRSIYGWWAGNLVVTHTAAPAVADDFPVFGTA